MSENKKIFEWKYITSNRRISTKVSDQLTNRQITPAFSGYLPIPMYKV